MYLVSKKERFVAQRQQKEAKKWNTKRFLTLVNVKI
jgi:hypothetical protein